MVTGKTSDYLPGTKTKNYISTCAALHSDALESLLEKIWFTTSFAFR